MPELTLDCVAQGPFGWKLDKEAKHLTLFCREKDSNIIFSFLC